MLRLQKSTPNVGATCDSPYLSLTVAGLTALAAVSAVAVAVGCRLSFQLVCDAAVAAGAAEHS
jgi:hypothetical protein